MPNKGPEPYQLETATRSFRDKDSRESRWLVHSHTLSNTRARVKQIPHPLLPTSCMKGLAWKGLQDKHNARRHEKYTKSWAILSLNPTLLPFPCVHLLTPISQTRCPETGRSLSHFLCLIDFDKSQVLLTNSSCQALCSVLHTKIILCGSCHVSMWQGVEGVVTAKAK